MKNKKPFYSKNTLLLFRLFSIVSVVILLISFIRDFIIGTLLSKTVFFVIFFTSIKISAITLLSMTSIFPYKIGFCSIIAFIYSGTIIFTEPSNPMGLFMFILGIISLYARGFFNSHKKLKFLISIIIFLILNLTQLRFGSEIFFTSIIETLGFAFVQLLIVYFFTAAIKNAYNINSSSNILNLKNYAKLTIRDALWLIQIQNKVKYDAIAIKSKVAPGTVKNRLKFIFSVLEVGDKHGFLNEYSTFEICYGEYSSEQISSMTFTDDDFIE